MRRPAVVAALTVLAAVLAVGGCGIPDQTTATPLGVGPSTGNAVGNNLTPSLPKRQDADKAVDLINAYMAVAAGDADDAVARVKQFLTPKLAATFHPAAGIRVVHLLDTPLNNPGSDDVSFTAVQVGTLNGNGVLDPSTDTTASDYRFQVDTLPGEAGLFVGKAPNMLLLQDDQLNTYYEQRAIYFWNTAHTALVPDVRYLPRNVPLEQQPTEVLNWLTAGPSTWLADAVEALPDGTATIGNVPAVANDKLQINLTAQALPPDDKGALDRLRRQLMWSLRPNLPRYLELKIGHQVEGDWDQTDYLTSNPSYGLATDPERFVVYNEQIRRLSNSAYPNEPVPVLQPDANHGIRLAAISETDTHTYAAVVTVDHGKQTLRVAAAPAGQQQALRKVNLTGVLGQPVWAVTPQDPAGAAIGLITSGGRLYSFGPAGGAQQVDWPGGGGAPSITAIAVAPDARRVALIEGGRLYLSVLVTGGDGLQLAAPVQVQTPMHTLTAVDWSSEGWLVVAGTPSSNGRVALEDVSIDGALSSPRLIDIGNEAITYVTAYPTNPVSGRQQSGSVAYVTASGAFDALSGATKITVAALAQPVTDPPAGIQPTVPLFQH